MKDPTGLEISVHAHADDGATAALNSSGTKVQRKQDAKRAVLTPVVRSLNKLGKDPDLGNLGFLQEVARTILLPFERFL